MGLERPDLYQRHVHHADLYRCVAPPGEDPDEFFAPFLGDGYDCNYSPVPFPFDHCGLFEFQWTIGGKVKNSPFSTREISTGGKFECEHCVQITLFPDDLGMPIGLDDGRTEYYMTEVHFDNPELREDLDILAGFEIYYTSELRPTEIGHLQLGVMTNRT